MVTFQTTNLVNLDALGLSRVMGNYHARVLRRERGRKAPDLSGHHKEFEEMAKVKKKLTAAQKRARKKAKAERQKKYMWVFMNGKQVRVKRPPTIDGMDVAEYIQKNADPVWLHQNEMWEYIQSDEDEDIF